MTDNEHHIPVTRSAADARAPQGSGAQKTSPESTDKKNVTPWGGLGGAETPSSTGDSTANDTQETSNPFPGRGPLPQKDNATTPAVDAPSLNPSATSAESMDAAPVPGVSHDVPSAPKAASADGTNLNALRDRILHESTDTGFHKAATNAQTQTTTGEGERESKMEALREKAGVEKSERTPVPGIDPIVQPKTRQPTADEIRQKKIDEAIAMNASDGESEPSTMSQDTTGQASGEEEAKSPSVRALRTYRMDLSEAMEHQQTSVAGAIAAEETRRSKNVEPRVPSQQRPPSILGGGSYFLLGMSTILVLVALGGLAYLFLFAGKGDVEVAGKEIPSFFFTDAQEQIDVTGRNRLEFMDRLVLAREKTNVQLGAITQLYITERAVSPEGESTEELVSASDFLFKLDARAPGKFYRALSDNMMLGIHEFDGNQPFLVFKTSSFDNAYAGMLGWERTINADLTPLFGPIVAQIPQKIESTAIEAITISTTTELADGTSTTTEIVATTTVSTNASSTSGSNPLSTILTFEDMYISNREVRVLRNQEDKIVLLWAFPDRGTLIITTDADTLDQVIVRMNARQF